MLKARLEEFGFSTNESAIYLTLLEHSSSGPADIAKRTGLNRSYLYDILHRMVDKGMLSKIRAKGGTNFQASPPRHVAELLTLRATEFQRLLPQLEKIRETKESSTELYQGPQVVPILLRDILSRVGKDDIIKDIIPDETEFENVSRTLFDQYFRQLKERNCRELVLIRRGGHRLKGIVGEYRDLSPELIGNASTLIYADTVAEVIFGDPHTLIITRNATLVDAKERLFDHFWEKAADEPQGT